MTSQSFGYSDLSYLHKDVALRPQWQPFNVMDEYIVFQLRVHSSFPPFNPEACWAPPSVWN